MALALVFGVLILLVGWAVGVTVVYLVLLGLSEFGAPVWVRRAALVIVGTPLLAPTFLPSLIPAPVPLIVSVIWGVVLPSPFLAASIACTAAVLSMASIWVGSNKQSGR